MPNSATFVTTTYGVSYVSAGEADTYFDDQLYPEPWFQTDDAIKEKALVMATKKIDSQNLIGRKADPQQPLEFPRSLYSDACGVWVQETEVNQSVLDAVCEEALSLIRSGADGNKRIELQRQGVTSFSLGSLSETYGSRAASLPNAISSATASQLLAAYVGGSRGLA